MLKPLGYSEQTPCPPLLPAGSALGPTRGAAAEGGGQGEGEGEEDSEAQGQVRAQPGGLTTSFRLDTVLGTYFCGNKSPQSSVAGNSTLI